MRASQLTRDLPIAAPDPDFEVTGITHDSRRVVPGDLFVALAGERHDGRRFAGEAAARGAAAVLGAGAAPPGYPGRWLSAEEPRRLLGPLAARLYGHPDRELVTVGVTGTNGKSTVVALVAAILEAAGRPAGRIGTLGYAFGDLAAEGERTTPEASDLFRILRRMRDAGAAAVAMEVSSHALALDRVAGAAFDLAIFTNLSRDHLDFHRDLEDYFRAKRRLFERLKAGGAAAVHVGDPWGKRIASELPAAVTFGRGGAVAAAEVTLDRDGIRGAFATPRGELEFSSPLLGALNLDNLTAAVAGAEALGIEREAIRRGLERCAPLPGRMEPVEAGQPFPVVIDYAHTPAALEAAIASLAGFTGRRVIAVFGCGGDRDPGKREPMGRIAGEGAELPIVTSDNPRSEDPLAIIAAVEKGLQLSGNSRYRVLPDRRRAIREAIELAGPEWAVLVAGKGHERNQIVGDRALPFSDREEILRALEERFGTGKSG